MLRKVRFIPVAVRTSTPLPPSIEAEQALDERAELHRVLKNATDDLWSPDIDETDTVQLPAVREKPTDYGEHQWIK